MITARSATLFSRPLHGLPRTGRGTFHANDCWWTLVRSCDFVDRSSFLSQASDPRNHPNGHEIGVLRNDPAPRKFEYSVAHINLPELRMRTRGHQIDLQVTSSQLPIPRNSSTVPLHGLHV